MKSELSLLSHKELIHKEFVSREIDIKYNGRIRYINNRRKTIGQEFEFFIGSNGDRYFITKMIDSFSNQSIRITQVSLNGITTSILIEDRDNRKFLNDFYQYCVRVTSNIDRLGDNTSNDQ